jgi:DNA-binding winged helix-turn-helix (wHTH) protein/tetratricopeptide (TPR) repeat protein
MIRFGRYQLEATQGLRRGTQEVRLTPKSLEVLHYLAERQGRVVTKDELFAAIWSDVAVTDSALATCIQEIRRALDDDARLPRFVETVHRRGYRFVARTSSDAGAPADVAVLARTQGPLIGRDANVAAVLAAFDTARQGTRRVCFISGEPGVGKSAVFGECLARIAESGVATTWAQCVERSGPGEPYQPLLDALMRLCRRPAGERTIMLLERHAPMWLAQLPGLLTPRQSERLQRVVVGASRDRMLRELAYAVEAMTADDPLVLGIEDIHWSDPSTLDWLSSVSARPEPARLLIVATLRPPASGETGTPVAVLRDTLRTKRLATEIALEGLDEASAVRYVLDRLPPAPGGSADIEQLSRRARRHTGGNPLFLSNVLDELIDRGIVRQTPTGWTTYADVETADLGIPAAIRPLIERQLESLPRADRTVLETASVVGETFSIEVVAAAAGDAGAEELESTLGAPALRRYLRAIEPAGSPDGRGGRILAFAHTLYRDVLYDGIPFTRRSELHRRVGGILERTWGEDAVQIAAELAVHFERGGDRDRAIHHLTVAAENARRRSAFREARAHYERALELLGRLPDDDRRATTELQLRIGLGAAAMALSGFGSPDVEAAYSRARTLSHRVGDGRRFTALFGLWLFYWGRGDLATAEELTRELRDLADGADGGLRLQALHASWATAFSQGRLEQAVEDARAGVALYQRDRDAPLAATFGSHDAGVCARMFAGRALVLQGRAAEAARAGDEAVELANGLDHPFSIALALTFRAAVEQSRGDAESAGRFAADAIEPASEMGFGLMLAWCTTIRGWATARSGDPGGGLATIAHGIESARRTGSDQFLPFLLGMEADACLAAGRSGRGREAAAEALAIARRTGERFYEAVLLRLTGELGLAAGVGRAEADDAFRSAVTIARSQGAALLAVRSAIRLVSRPDAPDQPTRLDLLRATLTALPGDSGLREQAEAAALLGE